MQPKITVNLLSTRRKKEIYKKLSIVSGILLILQMSFGSLFFVGFPAAALATHPSGTIWTTNGDCGEESQDVNHYAIGDTVYINGKNFEGEHEYDWYIKGQPGGSSCDPGVKVAQDDYVTESDGSFCFPAYTVQSGDCGEYKVSFDGKNDNYNVDGEGTCELQTTKTDNVDPVNPGDQIEYHIVLENIGTGTCTGPKVRDYFDQNTSYVSSNPAYTEITSDYIRFDAPTLEPGETFDMYLTVQVSQNTELCGSTLLNKTKHFSNETTYIWDGEEETQVVCEEPRDPYCGDGIVNQEWEECDGNDVLQGEKCDEGCDERCQIIDDECSDKVFARVNVSDVQNGSQGDMTSEIFLGSSAYSIPSGTWFLLSENGVTVNDPDISGYEDVEGLAVQRLDGQVRVVMYGSRTGTTADIMEHIDGNIEFYNATVTRQSSDPSNDYPNGNQLEKGFDGNGVGSYEAGDDEVWIDSDVYSNFWLTTTTADDGYYTDWSIVEDCDEPVCGDGNVDEELDEQCDDGNTEDGDGCSANCTNEPAVIKAYKVVCEDEEYLPNWGLPFMQDGEPTEISSTTAQEFVNASEQHCWFEPDWSFQWGYNTFLGVNKLDGDHIGPADGSNGYGTNTGTELGDWRTFPSATGSSGEPAVVYIDDLETADNFWVRENLQEGYIPFANPPEGIWYPVSAEMYCGSDIANFDNFDTILDAEYGGTYYCVAFNAPEPPAVCNPEVELVTNGSFEEPIVTNARNWDVFNSSSVGWFVEWVSPDNDAPDPALLELHRGVKPGWTPAEDDQYAELDSDYNFGSQESASVKISQNVETINGEAYSLSFAFSPRPGEGEDNVLNVYIDDVLMDTYYADGGSDANGNTDWTYYTINFVADSETTKISFADGGNSNTLGTFIDDVSVRCGVEPTGTLKICKQNDLNGNGELENGEPVLYNWTFNIGDDQYTDGEGDDVENGCVDVELPYGTYNVTEEMQEGWEQTGASGNGILEQDGSITVEVGESNPVPIIYFLNTEEEEVCDSTISGMKINNLTKEGLEGWIIELREPTGLLIATTSTDGLGNYTFENVCTGDYIVQEVQQEGWTQTSPIDPTYYPVNITESGQCVDNRNFYNEPTHGSLKVCKMKDADGTLDEIDDQSPVSNWSFTIIKDQFDQTKQTGDDGCVIFENLYPGDYLVDEDTEDHPMPANWTAIDPESGEKIVEVVNGDETETTFYNYEGGNYGSICGYKYEDEDGNIQTPNTTGLEGWTIVLNGMSNCEEGDEWADSVVSYAPGSPVIAERSDPTKALGAAQYNDTINFVSLGFGGELILEFDNYIINGDGGDISVVETSYGGVDCNAYPEKVQAYASQNGVDWENLGTGSLDTLFAMPPSMTWAKYVKLVDISDPQKFPASADGYDIDGVKAKHCGSEWTELDRVETNEDGEYCFLGLETGPYNVSEEEELENRNNWYNTSESNYDVYLTAPEELGVDFSNTQNASVFGYKFYDDDKDGVWDDGENTIPEWNISLLKKVEEVYVPSNNDGINVSSIASLENGKTYVLAAIGKYTYWPGSPEGTGLADAEYSDRPSSSYGPGWVKGEGSGSPLLEDGYLDVMVDDANVDWGTYEADDHYDFFYTGTGNPVNFKILDSYYGDNSGGINVIIYELVEQVLTDGSGYYNFTDLIPGSYAVVEDLPENWVNTLPSNEGIQFVLSSGENKEVNFGNYYEEPVQEPVCGNQILENGEQCDDGNTEDGDGCSATCTKEVLVNAFKIICEDESDLPNWGEGDIGLISSTTASDFIAQHPSCYWDREPWEFQYGTSIYSGNGDVYGPISESGWEMFDTATNGSEPAKLVLDWEENMDKLWFREVLKEGYIPYAYPPEPKTGDLYSAELYCDDDILNYDNMEWIDWTPERDEYYCVAFNVPETEPVCGDGEINQEWEQCDDGVDGSDTCTPRCTLIPEEEPYCGDGHVDNGEQCDDGNTEDGDGCSANCQTEQSSGGGGGGGAVIILSSSSGGSEEPVVLGEEGAPVLVITKSIDQEFANPGDTEVEYKIIVTNNGNLTAFDVLLDDVLPDGLTYFIDGTSQTSWSLGDIAPGDSKEVTYTVNVSEDAGAGVYTNTATASAANHDAVSASADLEVRTIEVLAATGFRINEFVALLAALLIAISAALFLKRKTA